jgi:alpha-beta hydrolase superfamily lysophospholipase
MKLFLATTFICLFTFFGNAQKTEQTIDVKTINFPSKDGLTITADVYKANDSKDFILLCHQAGFSRGEYKDTAVKLFFNGYSSMAIDQRSGFFANDVINETAKLAKEKGLAHRYLDTKQDIEAAIDYAYNLNNKKPIILVGSSYSSSLVLIIATNNPKIKAVTSFSPGEYLKPVKVGESIKDLDIPVFVTSSKKEISQTADIIKDVKSTQITHFKPEVDGIHGSRALWETTKGNETYWKAFNLFLDQVSKSQ